MDGRRHAHTDNVKTVYPTTNKVCGGYNKITYTSLDNDKSTCKVSKRLVFNSRSYAHKLPLALKAQNVHKMEEKK